MLHRARQIRVDRCLVARPGFPRWAALRHTIHGRHWDAGRPHFARLHALLHPLGFYNQLKTCAAGARSAFTEPATGPTAGTGHTLDQVMDVAPEADNTDGAIPAEVLNGKTFPHPWCGKSVAEGAHISVYTFTCDPVQVSAALSVDSRQQSEH
jgi:hypothetical protein